MIFNKKKNQANENGQFESTQKFLEIDQIKEDLVFMKDKSLRGVLMVSGINMELRSNEEQEMVLFSYQEALNSLDFPIQILVQSRKVDLTSYISMLEDSVRNQVIPLIKEQTEEYIYFLKQILANVNVMDKRFFVVVPYFPNIIAEGSKGIMSFFDFKKPKSNEAIVSENYQLNKKQIDQRIEIVSSLLGNLGLNATRLPTEALIELFYACYNPETAGHEHIKHLDELGAKYITKREAVQN